MQQAPKLCVVHPMRWNDLLHEADRFDAPQERIPPRLSAGPALLSSVRIHLLKPHHGSVGALSGSGFLEVSDELPSAVSGTEPPLAVSAARWLNAAGPSRSA